MLCQYHIWPTFPRQSNIYWESAYRHLLFLGGYFFLSFHISFHFRYSTHNWKYYRCSLPTWQLSPGQWSHQLCSAVPHTQLLLHAAWTELPSLLQTCNKGREFSYARRIKTLKFWVERGAESLTPQSRLTTKVSELLERGTEVSWWYHRAGWPNVAQTFRA